jgi:3-hydroxybutyryl-CoA dehydrogenase
VRGTFANLASLKLFATAAVETLAARVDVVPHAERGRVLGEAEIVFEGVPEILDLKRAVLADASRLARPDATIASTTSTIMVDDMASAVEKPERFLNAHWLNPAYLVPLVEVSPGERTDPDVVQRLRTLLQAIGKVPVVCKSSPGFIVPRIQALAMNEAARMVEEGVASAEDIDKAIRVGFGFRFAVLGLLEFIDWGGGDILFHASRYLEGALGHERYRAPEIIGRNMQEGRIGLRTGHGFLDYEGLDVDAYRRERLSAFIGLAKHLGLSREPDLGPPS